jgi:glycosyltransferase involved in cell wall biosynthesis
LPRILFCCPTPVTPTLGASKVYIEAAEAFRRVRWEADLVGPEEVAGRPVADLVADQPAYLREYLRGRAAGYDVVEYEHHALPFPRAEFPAGPLFVARSVLLAHPHAEVRFPPVPTLRGRLGWLLRGRREAARWRQVVRQADDTLRGADLINVSNTRDAALLRRHGHPEGKIVVRPFGLFPTRLAAFEPDPDAVPDPPAVAFVGTFDPRKGMAEFPRIVAGIVGTFPAATFRLIGTAGLVPTADGVLRFFPRAVRPNVRVVPWFDPAELPGLLAGCSLGVFPSHLEGFPFGVLEMLAAGLPVVAYNVPGPPMMLPAEYLVPRGDGAALARTAVELLRDPGRLRAARQWARARAAEFDWERVAADTAALYLARRAGRS